MEFSYIPNMVGRLDSLDTLRRNASYNIRQLSVIATTQRNSGVVSGYGKQYHMKCFFIAMSHGFRNIGMTIIGIDDIITSKLKENEIINLYAFELAEMFNMLNNTKIDTYNPEHLKIVESMANLYCIKIEFYIGHYRNNNWYTTPDPAHIIGTGKKIIRILNKGDHFEFLEKLENGFVEDLTNSTIDSAVRRQEQIYENIQQTQSDLKLAYQIALEDELRDKERIQQEEIDLNFAKLLNETEQSTLLW